MVWPVQQFNIGTPDDSLMVRSAGRSQSAQQADAAGVATIDPGLVALGTAAVGVAARAVIVKRCKQKEPDIMIAAIKEMANRDLGDCLIMWSL
jgi:AmiR/NasT family two-component response regulator